MIDATKFGLGWVRGLPDQRDRRYTFGAAAAVAPQVDLRATGNVPAIWNQQDIGSCVPHGVGFAYVFSLRAQGLIAKPDDYLPSRLFVYYNGRVIENTVDSDSGLTITDGIKELNRYGAPPESGWPYVTSRFTEKPPEASYREGLLHEAVKYAQVGQTPNEMRACLTAGLPFVIGFTVYDSFQSSATASNGVMLMPRSTERVLGGHCIAAVGYLPGSALRAAFTKQGETTVNISDSTMYYIMRNSWGWEWGHNGYCFMPEQYLTGNLSDDFWTVQTVSAPDPTPPAPVAKDLIDRKAAIAALQGLATAS